MRYYKIDITNLESGTVERTFTSFLHNINLAGALNIEIDMPVSPFATPAGAGLVRIWGISLKDISQSSDFNNKGITVYGGMQKGLPLANPAQSGLLFQGQIYQCYGNWIGTDQTLDFVIQTSTGTIAEPKNLSFNWKKGTKLADAIATTLKAAFPKYKQEIKINDKLVLPSDQPGYYSTITQFAQYIKQVSQTIIGGDYPGVDMNVTQTTLKVYDGSSPNSPKEISFKDLIGQPTWLDPLTIQYKTVMRADLKIDDYIKFPTNTVAISSAGGRSPQINAKSVFQGTFRIRNVRHVGNFRARDAGAWVTVYDVFSTKAAA